MTNMIGIESCLFLKPKVLAYFNNLDSLYAHREFLPRLSVGISALSLFFFVFRLLLFYVS